MSSTPSILRRATVAFGILVLSTVSMGPGSPSVAASASADGQWTPPSPIARDQDGLFYLVGEINGARIRFLVDTGASVVVLTPADARRAGVAERSSPTRVRMETASGSAAMRWARLDRIRIGQTEVRDIDAAIIADGLPVSLLGQNALSRFGSVTIVGEQLHLR